MKLRKPVLGTKAHTIRSKLKVTAKAPVTEPQLQRPCEGGDEAQSLLVWSVPYKKVRKVFKSGGVS